MITRSVLLVVLLACVGCNAGTPDSDGSESTVATVAAPPLEGAWAVAEITTTGPDSATLNIHAPQPGFILFTGRHYSLVRINTAAPRPALPPADSATVDALRAVWGNSFTAQAGTYEMVGSNITLIPLVAKNPAVMAAGSRTETQVRLEGDSLWVTAILADTVAANPNALTFKYVRVR